MPYSAGSWDEYRQLVLKALDELRNDFKEIEHRIDNLEKYADIHTQFNKLRDDFERFLVHYEKQLGEQNQRFVPIEVKQKLMFAAYGVIIGAIVSQGVQMIFDSLVQILNF